MTVQRLASVIAKIEGKKSQAKIGDIREILKIIVSLEAANIVLLDAEGKAPVGPLYVLGVEAEKKAQKVLDKRRKTKKAKK
jgi:hypothetical protein